jgi:predicted enzyme related to lactoylglutathione lyase
VALALDSVTFDCADVMRVAHFWADALGWELDPESEPDGARVVRDPSRRSDSLYFQPVPEPKVVKNRLHLDLRATGSLAAEVERLEGLGATVVRRVDEEGSFWTVMQDPEGNELCVLRGPEDGWPGYAEA